MKNLKLIILIDVSLLLIITLIIVSRKDKINREIAQVKLEQALVKIPIEQNLVDNVTAVKESIKDNIENSKIINEATSKFPVYTIVDGYEFKIEEKNNNLEVVGNNTAKENNIQNIVENILENSLENPSKEISNSINEVPNENLNNAENEKITVLVKYANDTKTDKGITVSTTEDGMVTINGKSTDKLFIKISNNVQISNTANLFYTWLNEDRNSNRKRKTNISSSFSYRKSCIS